MELFVCVVLHALSLPPISIVRDTGDWLLCCGATISLKLLLGVVASYWNKVDSSGDFDQWSFGHWKTTAVIRDSPY